MELSIPWEVVGGGGRYLALFWYGKSLCFSMIVACVCRYFDMALSTVKVLIR